MRALTAWSRVVSQLRNGLVHSLRSFSLATANALGDNASSLTVRVLLNEATKYSLYRYQRSPEGRK